MVLGDLLQFCPCAPFTPSCHQWLWRTITNHKWLFFYHYFLYNGPSKLARPTKILRTIPTIILYHQFNTKSLNSIKHQRWHDTKNAQRTPKFFYYDMHRKILEEEFHVVINRNEKMTRKQEYQNSNHGANNMPKTL